MSNVDESGAMSADEEKRSQLSAQSPSEQPQDVEKAQEGPISPMDPRSFPDGGKDAWLCVAGASAGLFVSFGWINCVGVFQEYYQANQLREYAPSDIAWISSVQGKLILQPWTCMKT